MSKKNLIILSLIILAVIGYGLYSKSRTTTNLVANTSPISSAQITMEKDGVDIHEKITDAAEVEHFLAIKDSDLVLGQENAPVTIIEYSSLSCPHCRSFHEEVLPSIKTTYIDSGKVKMIHRDYPIDPASLAGATYLKCISKDKYYDHLKLLFDKQSDWAYKSDYQEKLEAVAKLDGMSLEEFNSCMANKSIEKEILESRAEADKYLKLNATPIYIINGKIYIGLKDKNFFFDRIEEALGNKPVSVHENINTPGAMSVPSTSEMPALEGQSGHYNNEEIAPEPISPLDNANEHNINVITPSESNHSNEENNAPNKVNEHIIQPPAEKIIDSEHTPPASTIIHQEQSGDNKSTH